MLTTFGYPYTIELSTRPDKALGSPERWKEAEDTLAEVLKRRGQDFTYDVGGGAFYGPKLDFKLIDAIGRKWQGPTVQLDFNLPERFQLEYVGEDNARHRPVMLHRTLLGSMERFVGGLIEHYAGNFPLWLAWEQVAVIPVRETARPYAEQVAKLLRDRGLRANLDAQAGDMRSRIKEATERKANYILVVGDREAAARQVSVRRR